MAKDEQPTKNTPPTHKESQTNAKSKVDYPNYAIWQTRSGNMPWHVSDTKGNEFIKCQHRTGSHWELTSSGAFKMVASKNREDITFGKHVSYVTGAQDTTVKGDSSTRTEGTRRTTTNGDDENTVKGKQVTTAKSVNVTAAEQFDIAAQSFTAKTKGMLMQATDGPVSVSAVGNATLSSSDGSVGLASESGAVTLDAGGKISAQASETHFNGGGGQIVMKGGKVYINCGNFEEPSSVWKGRPEGSTTTESA
jgi:hypothetical protein